MAFLATNDWIFFITVFGVGLLTGSSLRIFYLISKALERIENRQVVMSDLIKKLNEPKFGDGVDLARGESCTPDVNKIKTELLSKRGEDRRAKESRYWPNCQS